MLTRIRQYLTPVVATIALALLGATAIAVTPEIMDRVGDNSLDQVADTQELTDATDTTGVIDELKAEDSETDPPGENGEDDGDVPTPTVAPAGKGSEKPNHGHFVSCVAHMAKEDSTLEGRQKGAVVSYAAKQDVVLPKGDETACAAAYAAAKAGAAAAADGDDTREKVTESSTEAERQKTASSGVAEEARKAGGQRHGPNPASHKGGGRGPK